MLSVLLLALAPIGCAMLGADPARRSGGDARCPEPMTPSRMELAFAEQVDAIEGPTGAIRTRVDGVNVYLFSDPERDRMQIMAPIGRLDRLDPRIATILLAANFQNTLDARYAVSDGVVFSIYLHPISTLTPEMIASALDQVVSLHKTFGTSFSSGVQPLAPAGEGSREDAEP